MTKTNAMRLLEQAGIPFTAAEYEVDEKDLSGVHVANQLGVPCEQVFKTLVVKGEKKGICVCCIPVAQELNLKKVATVIGDKKVELLPVKDLQNTTGYIRGGCSPIGMKKKYPTFFDESVILFEKINISAGVRGCQLLVNPIQLMEFVDAKTADLTI